MFNDNLHFTSCTKSGNVKWYYDTGATMNQIWSQHGDVIRAFAKTKGGLPSRFGGAFLTGCGERIDMTSSNFTPTINNV